MDHSPRFVEELLECSVCMHSFETSGPRTPKMLPCQHTFCFDCIKNMMDFYRVECPACRQRFHKSAEDLPNHFVLLQLLDCGNRNKDRKCEGCQLQTEDAKSYCESCIDVIVERELAKSIALTQKYEKAQDDGSTIRRRQVSQSPNEPSDPVIDENISRRQNQSRRTSVRGLHFLHILMLLNVLMLIFLFFYHCEIVMISIGRIIFYLNNEVIPLLYNNAVKTLLIMSQIIHSMWRWLQYVWVTYSSSVGAAILELTGFICMCVYTVLLYIFKFTLYTLTHLISLLFSGIVALIQGLAANA